MARFFTIFLIVTIVSTLKAEEHDTAVGEGVKTDHQTHEKEGGKSEHIGKLHVGEKEGGGVKKEEMHGHTTKNGETHEYTTGDHIGKHHVGEKEGEGVKKEETHGHTTGDHIGKHHVGEKEGGGVKKEETHGHTTVDHVEKKENHTEREVEQRPGSPQPRTYRDETIRGNISRAASDFGRDEQEEKVRAARINNIIINGIPEKENEDMKDTVEYIGQKLGFQYPLDDVDTAYRLICTKVPRPIIIRLVDLQIKAQWIIAYRRCRLWTEQIYMEEHLTKTTQKLCHATRIWASGKNYPHVWTWHGHVFYRKRENPLRYKVVNMDHLLKLQAEEKENEITDRPPKYSFRS